MMQATKVRKGMLIKIDNVPYTVLKVTHLTPGNKRAMIICNLRNLQTGLSKEKRFRSSERIEETEIELVDMEYIYSDDDRYYFMNLENYEQIPVDRDLIADVVKFMTPNIHVKVEFYEGKPFGIVLPKTVTLKVIETQAYIKEATAQAQPKPATLEGGHVCQVPPFIEVGDSVKIDTGTGEYAERASLEKL